VTKGKRLQVTVTPTTAWDVSVSLVLGPAVNCADSPRTCLVGADDEEDGGSERVTYTNKSGVPETVFVIVDAYKAGVTGPFTLLAEIL
jgi:hypothetical protein